MSVIIPTKKCNLRCTHCFRTDFQGGYLDPALLERFLAEMNTKKRSKAYTLSGGEPTIHPQLDQIYAAFRNTGNSTTMVTNGTVERGVQITIANKDVIDSIDISLDCADPVANDVVRGKGSFALAMAGVKAYIDAGISVNLLFSLHDSNVQFIRAAFDLAMSTGSMSILFTSLDPTTKGTAGGLDTTVETMEWAFNKIERVARRYPDVEWESNDSGITPNTAQIVRPSACDTLNGNPYANLTLLPTGEIAMCCDLYDIDLDTTAVADHPNVQLPTSLGNYATQSLSEIMRARDLQIAELRTRRRESAEAGLLVNGREFTCTDCKFYHVHNNPPNSSPTVIPIIPQQ